MIILFYQNKSLLLAGCFTLALMAAFIAFDAVLVVAINQRKIFSASFDLIIEFHLKLREILSLAFDLVLAIICTRSEPFNTAPAINIQRRKIISVLFDLVLALRNSCKLEVAKLKTTCTSSFDEIGVVLVSKYNYKIICRVFGTSAASILKLWLPKYRGSQSAKDLADNFIVVLRN